MFDSNNEKEMVLASAFKIVLENVDYFLSWKRQQKYMYPKTRRGKYQLGTNSKIQFLVV